MSNLDNNQKKKESEKKFQFSTKARFCFACGEKLSPEDQKRDTCPYCGVELDKDDFELK
jgi:predicted RNA-binding Zn-ribbon protein involved in translation (DUF1610 family)